MKKPSWFPEWAPGSYPPFTFHAEVWDRAVAAAVKASFQRVEALLAPQTDDILKGPKWWTISHEEWQQLRREAGLE